MATKKINNPIAEAKTIEDEFSKYIESTFQISNLTYNELFERELHAMEDSLYKGPYLCSSLPYKTSFTIKQLIESNGFRLHKSFKKLGGIKEDMQLYSHQVEAIKKIESKHSVVVTTGTGSGKTECFLFPILDSIIKEIEDNKNKESGIRAIFLFPMNALINDQIERVRNLLSTYPDIKFGFFTGETPEEDEHEAKERFEQMYGKPISNNELITRKQMRDNPPHILFTNYSMLEYLLIRPSDAKLISEDSMKFWRYFVLDEAHTYRGALGIEISMLLRRLTGIAKVHPQFILTSATLGKGKQDVKKIIKFASSLTSTNFDEEDIIFAERIGLPVNPSYLIDENDYSSILKNADNISELKKIFEKYDSYDSGLSFSNNVYALLSRDKLTHMLQAISSSAINFFEACKILKINDYNNLVSLIELIAKATSTKEKKLFDIKYHMLLKAPDGAFVTIGKQKNLSLKKCQSINGRHAFKIGICQNCKTPYIMGRINDGTLIIDDEADIDEEYQEKINKIGFYLMADCLTQAEIDNIKNNHADEYEEYIVCAKCGHIRRAADAKAKKCDCNDEEVVLFKYSEHDDPSDNVYSNNIKKCPICEFSSKTGGVVLGFHIGKDRATAVIAQILYGAMEYPQIKVEAKGKGLFDNPEDKYINGVKQFIAFSDARQQAAFFNKFLNTLDLRFLKKAMIWDILKSDEVNHQPLTYTELVSRLNSKFQEHPISFNPAEANKHSQAAALYELLNVDGKNSAEGLGLYAFQLVLPDVYYKDDLIEKGLKANGFNGVTPELFRIMTQVTLNTFRTAPAIKYNVLTTDPTESEDLLGYRHVRYSVKKQIIKSSSGNARRDIKSFLPINNGSENKNVRFIRKFLNYDIKKACDFLSFIYDAAVSAKLIELDSLDGTGKIPAYRYTIHSYLEKGFKFYYCAKCKKLTLYNINNKCPDPDCDGDLHECDPDKYFKHNYYRKTYMSRPIECMASREHTAQIKAVEAKQIQRDFKEKKINIISCSTTFEMGIDLGSLNTIFMRNIPPTPANYAQRAGRAGRRADTSAFILTFCSLSSHDYTFFEHPEPMIAGIVDPPYFSVENSKIVVRHIAASALGFYFKKCPDGFQNIDVFLKDNYIEKFLTYIHDKPKDLSEYIDNYLLLEPDLKATFDNFKWLTYMEDSSKDSLINMKEGLLELIETYNTAIRDLENKKPKGYGRQIDQYRDELDSLKYKNSLIQYLARYSVIPRYGFPVDNTQLRIYDFESGDFDKKYDLTRDLSIAISEYAPDSEVIVDNKKYTSRYIYTPHPGAQQKKSYFIECPHCKQYNVFPVKNIDRNTLCKYCKKSLDASDEKIIEFIRPLKGFVTDFASKNSRRLKPARSYASETRYVGDGAQPGFKPINIADVIIISEFKNEELLALNENDFYYCEMCGYTILDKDHKIQSSESTKKHKNHKGYDCDNEVLRKTHLGHTFRTDLVKIQFSGISELLEYDTSVSVLYSLLEGISSAFNIERNDIGGMVFNIAAGTKPYEIILFDTVAGGAGHVKRLESKENLMIVLAEALKKVSQDCCAEDTSCYNCLRNFYNQKIHPHLKRGLAKMALIKIIDSINSKRIQMDISNINNDLHGVDLLSFINQTLYTEDEKKILTHFVELMNGDNVFKPSGYGITIKSGDNKTYFADFYWKEKNILLFSENNLNSFNSLSEHKSKYDCYLLNENLSLNDLIKKIRR